MSSGNLTHSQPQKVRTLAELAPVLSLLQTWSDELEVGSIQELSQFPSDLSDEIQDRGLGLVCSTE